MQSNFDQTMEEGKKNERKLAEKVEELLQLAKAEQ